jgi:FeS assembly SUF system protein
MSEDVRETVAEDATLDRAEAILADDASTGADRKRLAEVEALGERIVEAIKTCYDPEIPVNIYELGLIYKVDVEDDDTVLVDMTLTSPHCPVAETLPVEVKDKIKAVEGVRDCEINLVWDPPWHPSMMSEEAQLELGMIY